MSQIEQIKQIKEIYKQELMSKTNVVAVGVGYKYINGVKTDELSVVVNVSQKVSLEQLNTKDIVPAELDNILTDVVETGNIQALYNPTEKFRPASGGVSIGHFDVTAGTLGVTVVKETESIIPEGESFISINDMIVGYPISKLTPKNEYFILSNNHVLVNGNHAEIGDSIYQPGVVDGGTENDTIAQLHSFVPIDFEGTNKVDAALAKPLNNGDIIPKEILEIGEISGVVEAELGMSVRKYGRTTQLTTGTVTQIYVTVDVGGYPDGTARFEEQIITTCMSGGGDSGSLLIEQNGQKAVGLLFAGSGTITVHNRIANVEEALEIKLQGNTTTLKGCRLVDSQDITKQMQFSLSGISSETTRVLTVPNKNGEIALVGNSGGGYKKRNCTGYDFSNFIYDGQWHELDLSWIEELPPNTLLHTRFALMSTTHDDVLMKYRDENETGEYNCMIIKTSIKNKWAYGTDFILSGANKKIYYRASPSVTDAAFIIKGW